MSIQLIQQAINYMEEHLYEDICYADVAKSAHMTGKAKRRETPFVSSTCIKNYPGRR